jgi:Ca2+/Na+ antiporter
MREDIAYVVFFVSSFFMILGATCIADCLVKRKEMDGITEFIFSVSFACFATSIVFLIKN